MTLDFALPGEHIYSNPTRSASRPHHPSTFASYSAPDMALSATFVLPSHVNCQISAIPRKRCRPGPGPGQQLYHLPVVAQLAKSAVDNGRRVAPRRGTLHRLDAKVCGAGAMMAVHVNGEADVPISRHWHEGFSSPVRI